MSTIYNQIKSMLDKDVDDIFLKIQQDNDIDAGDVAPLDQLQLDEDIELLAKQIAHIIEYQRLSKEFK